MNKLNQMTWSAFKSQLEEFPGLKLQFEYETGKWVKPSYHLTEIKQAAIVSVDCGGQMNSWTEIILQLWEPEVLEKGREEAMQVQKAISIIHLVEKSLALHPAAFVKIEFGNADFDTRQLNPQAITADGGNLIVQLSPDFTQCKAMDRGASCGPIPVVQNCSPDSGCCS